MIVEKHTINAEAIEEVFDFYELSDIELADGSMGSVKTKVGTFTLSQLEAQKAQLNGQIASIDEKIASANSL